MKSEVIGIPLGTRLHQVVLLDTETHIWIAVKSRGPDYNKWQGTYLRVMPSGEVTRVTLDDALPEYMDIMVIKPERGTSNGNHNQSRT